LLVKVKNTCVTPLNQKQLQEIIQKYLVKKRKPQSICKEDSYNVQTLKNSSTNRLKTNITKLSENLSKDYQKFQRSTKLTEIAKSLDLTEEAKIIEEVNLSTKKLATMEGSVVDQSMFINFDHLLDDLCNDTYVQSNDDAILDQVLQELSTNSCQESILSDEEPFDISDLDLPDLSELPLEDFTNLESFFHDDCEDTIKEYDTIQSEVTSSMGHMFNIDDVLEDISNQSSPSGCNAYESEFNNLLDSMFDSDFMQEMITHNGVNTEVSDASAIFETTSVDVLESSQVDVFINAGSKRKLSSVDSVDVIDEKCTKQDEEVLPLKVKDKETVKEAVRRVKNNQASRVTRAKRKEKHTGLFKQQTELEKSNAQLRIKLEVMQKEAEILRKVLVSKLSSCKN